MLHNKISIEDQIIILKELFDFNLVNTSDDSNKPHYVLFDEDGNEFYGYDKNIIYEFDTWSGIITYAKDMAVLQTKYNTMRLIKENLNVTIDNVDRILHDDK